MAEEDPEAALANAQKILAPKKALLVLTSTTAYPDETPTGFWLSEAAHPAVAWLDAGWTVDIASITGAAQADPASVEDATKNSDKPSLDWLETNKETLTSTLKLADVPLEDNGYDVLFFCGGFGAMWDFPDDEAVKALTKTMWEAGKIVGAVCHGPIALINVELSDGTKLLAGKDCTGFSNAEETAMGKTDVVAKPSGPGSCEDMMGGAGVEGEGAVEGAAGGVFSAAGVFEANVAVSGNLYTGQNPPSASPLATAILYALDPIRAEFDPLRAVLLKEREELAAQVEAAKKGFTTELKELKAKEAANSDKIEALQIKSIASRDWLLGQINNMDCQIMRVAHNRQVKVSGLEKLVADAAVVEE
tara:strand:+ start:300 stop:1385 length:1086 start_codon:yes stop_codon:yes gene_type:complete